MRKSYLLAGIANFALAATLALAPSSARAQGTSDFASCGPDLPVCAAGVEDCCVRAFDPIASDKAIVIPMDRCHQVVAQSGKLAPPTATGSWCSNPGPFSANDNGQYEAYGLIFRLMQNGIPVYWIINPTKEPPSLTSSQNLNAQTYLNRDVDAWIVTENVTPPSLTTASLTNCNGACVAPVRLLNPTTLAPAATWSYSKKEFPLRGGAFVIAPEDRARFNAFFRRTGEFAGFAGNSNYDFSAVDLYEVQNGAKFVYQDYRTASPFTLANNGNGAPVAVRIDYRPPRLARLAPAGVSNIWLSLAKLNVAASSPACKTGAFSPSDAVFCDVTENDIQNGALVAGGFDWAWIDNWGDNSPCGSAAEIKQVDELRRFLTAQPGVRAGGHAVLMEAVIDVLEGCANKQFLGTPNAGVGLVSGNTAPSEPLILRRPHNVFMQWGDLPTDFAQGSLTRWRYTGVNANGYSAAHTDPTTGTLVRLVTEDRSAAGNTLCSRHRSTPACDVYANNANADYWDVAAYARLESKPENGVVFYMPGNQVNNGPSHLRMVLNTLISLPLATVPQLPNTTTREVSRSAPVVGIFNGVEAAVFGSFELEDPAPVVPVYTGASDNATFEFPYTKGHYRATNVALGNPIWDAASRIPTPNANGCGTWFSASCRTVFTNVTPGTNLQRTYISTANRATLKPLLGQIGGITFTNPETDTLIGRILAGEKQADGSWAAALGGIDRSSAAIIERSPLIATQRPQMAYVGGLDGMLHAFCVDVVGPCTQSGQELWAFIPRVLLPRLRLNDGRFDGSPKVSDVFGDFDNDGRREWKTILTVQVGSGQPGTTGFSPAVYALDVTNPADPKILWEVVTPAVRGANEIGVGTSLAMGPVQATGGVKNLVWIVTSNGGTGGAGLYVQAIRTETGAVEWTWTHDYLAPRTGSNPDVPASAIPGGPVGIDQNSTGNATWIGIPSIYGDIWLLEADSGQSVFGNNPLFRFSRDFHPVGASPTLYRDGSGRLLMAFGSGGYVDPVSTSWAPSSERQYMVSVAVDPSGGAPLSETSGGGDIAFVVDLGVGQRVFSQAVVSGGELFVTSDHTDVNDAGFGLDNDTGTLTRIVLATGSVADQRTIESGAASVDATGGRVFNLDQGNVVTSDYTGTFDAAGESVEFSMLSSSGAKLWLRVE